MGLLCSSSVDEANFGSAKKNHGSKYVSNTYLGPKVYRYYLLWAIWSPNENDNRNHDNNVDSIS